MIDRKEINYGNKRSLIMNFEKVVLRVRDVLKKEGFGILTEIDVRKTLKEKLNVDYEDYLILGACNPPFAYRALQAEKEVGLLLPCNVIIYSQNGKTIVSVINPVVAMGIVDNPKLKKIAEEVGEKLKRVLENLNIFYSCKLCGLIYEEESFAKECEDFCNKNNACNLEITRNAINKK